MPTHLVLIVLCAAFFHALWNASVKHGSDKILSLADMLLITQIKEVLADKVSAVCLSHRLIASLSCLVTKKDAMSLNMERIMKESGQDMSMMSAGANKPIFEINPEHALVARLKEQQDDARFADLNHILFDQAVLSEGGQLDDPAKFVHNLNNLLQSLLK